MNKWFKPFLFDVGTKKWLLLLFYYTKIAYGDQASAGSTEQWRKNNVTVFSGCMIRNLWHVILIFALLNQKYLYEFDEWRFVG